MSLQSQQRQQLGAVHTLTRPERSWVREMPPPPRRAVLAVVAAVLLIIVAASHGAARAPLDPDSRAADHDGGMACTGTVEKCVGGGEARRRELGWNNYIGYDALRRDAVPCSYRGASYYNCQPGGPANPYSRGCSAITQCRG